MCIEFKEKGNNYWVAFEIYGWFGNGNVESFNIERDSNACGGQRLKQLKEIIVIKKKRKKKKKKKVGSKWWKEAKAAAARKLKMGFLVDL